MKTTPLYQPVEKVRITPKEAMLIIQIADSLLPTKIDAGWDDKYYYRRVSEEFNNLIK